MGLLIGANCCKKKGLFYVDKLLKDEKEKPTSPPPNGIRYRMKEERSKSVLCDRLRPLVRSKKFSETVSLSATCFIQKKESVLRVLKTVIECNSYPGGVLLASAKRGSSVSWEKTGFVSNQNMLPTMPLYNQPFHTKRKKYPRVIAHIIIIIFVFFFIT